MNLSGIISMLDTEIAKLTQVREMLSSYNSSQPKKGRGRPKKAAQPVAAKKRSISAEGRARIAAAQKKRWAASKKAAK